MWSISVDPFAVNLKLLSSNLFLKKLWKGIKYGLWRNKKNPFPEKRYKRVKQGISTMQTVPSFLVHFKAHYLTIQLLLKNRKSNHSLVQWRLKLSIWLNGIYSICSLDGVSNFVGLTLILRLRIKRKVWGRCWALQLIHSSYWSGWVQHLVPECPLWEAVDGG